MHGYEANLELERRCVRDWAAISRPQVYYSMEKLAKLGLVKAGDDSEPAAGPDRRVFEATAKGRAAIAEALEHEDWATQRDRPAFSTWMALSWLARPGTNLRQIRRRQRFLEGELGREKATLEAILNEVGHPHHEAVWMVSLTIEQFQTELRWLQKVEGGLPKRAKAKTPEFAKTSEG
jgi:DNA-binding PadR family transcriptional regulator